MFFINFQILWSFSYFFLSLYLIVFFSIILFLIPSLNEIIAYSKFKKINNFYYLTGFDLYWLVLTPLVLFLIINLAWSGPTVSAWFGNLIFSSFQQKLSSLIIFFFYLTITLYCTSFYFSSKEIYDYLIVCFNFFFWTYFLFFSNTFFSFIFFIEILSTLIFLLLSNASFSTTYYFNNINLNLHNYFNQTTPFFFIQSLMYFFWISLISSLNLFFFLILFYLKFLTFDWFFFEFIFFYIINTGNFKEIAFIVFIWFNLIFSIFLKCGLAPLFFWKPLFFRGIPIHALLFYIIFYYFFILFFFIYFFLIYLNDLFYFFLGINIVILLLGFLIILSILCESYYIKTFLALSSVLNTLFIFLALNGTNVADFFFII